MLPAFAVPVDPFCIVEAPVAGHGGSGVDGLTGWLFPGAPDIWVLDVGAFGGGTLCVLSPAALVVIGVGGPIVVGGGVGDVVGAVEGAPGAAAVPVGGAAVGGGACGGAPVGGTALERLL